MWPSYIWKKCNATLPLFWIDIPYTLCEIVIQHFGTKNKSESYKISPTADVVSETNFYPIILPNNPIRANFDFKNVITNKGQNFFCLLQKHIFVYMQDQMVIITVWW